MAARTRDQSSRSSQSAPRNDAYVGLLVISLLAQIVAVAFFYLDFSAYPSSKPTVPNMPNLSAAPPSQPQAPPQGVPPVNGGQPN